MDELKIPKCMADLKDKKAQKGGKCFFQIKIRGDPLPEIKWFFNDNEIVDDDHFKMSVKENDHIYRLDVEDCCEDHYGKVKVVATNENGSSEKEANLEIQFPPEIAGPEEFKAGPGDTALVVFKVRAFPGADAVWFKLGGEIEGEGEEEGTMVREEIKIEGKGFERYDAGFKGSSDPEDQWEVHTLTVKDAVMEDAGEYRIKCVNRVGATNKDTSLAIVTEPPAFTTPLSDVTTQLGTTSSFETVVIGTPRPEVQWFRDGEELKKGKRVLFEEEANPEGGFKYRVTIRDIV
jgi:hypothetical protein